MRGENNFGQNHEFKAQRTNWTDKDVINVELDDETTVDVRSEVNRLVKEFLNYKTKPSLSVDPDDPHNYSDPQELSRRKQISRELRTLEMDNLWKLYKDVVYSTPIKLPRHIQQENRFSCTLASALNILKAYNLQGDLTESKLANIIGKDGSSKDIDVDDTLNFLQTLGLKNERIDSVLSMIERLIDGQIIMYTIPRSINHRVVISSVRINKGKIDFLFNDPLKERPYWVPYQYIVDLFGYDLQGERSAEAIIKK